MRDAAALLTDSNLPFMRSNGTSSWRAASASGVAAGGAGAGTGAGAGSAPGTPSAAAGSSAAGFASLSRSGSGYASPAAGHTPPGSRQHTPPPSPSPSSSPVTPSAAAAARAASGSGPDASGGVIVAGAGIVHPTVAGIVAQISRSGLSIPPMALRQTLTGLKTAEDYVPEDPGERRAHAAFLNALAAAHMRSSDSDRLYLHLQAELVLVLEKWLQELGKRSGNNRRGHGGRGGGGRGGGGAAAAAEISIGPSPMPTVTASFFAALQSATAPSRGGGTGPGSGAETPRLGWKAGSPAASPTRLAHPPGPPATLAAAAAATALLSAASPGASPTPPATPYSQLRSVVHTAAEYFPLATGEADSSADSAAGAMVATPSNAAAVRRGSATRSVNASAEFANAAALFSALQSEPRAAAALTQAWEVADLLRALHRCGLLPPSTATVASIRSGNVAVAAGASGAGGGPAPRSRSSSATSGGSVPAAQSDLDARVRQRVEAVATDLLAVHPPLARTWRVRAGMPTSGPGCGLASAGTCGFDPAAYVPPASMAADAVPDTQRRAAQLLAHSCTTALTDGADVTHATATLRFALNHVLPGWLAAAFDSCKPALLHAEQSASSSASSSAGVSGAAAAGAASTTPEAARRTLAAPLSPTGTATAPSTPTRGGAAAVPSSRAAATGGAGGAAAAAATAAGGPPQQGVLVHVRRRPSLLVHLAAGVPLSILQEMASAVAPQQLPVPARQTAPTSASAAASAHAARQTPKAAATTSTAAGRGGRYSGAAALSPAAASAPHPVAVAAAAAAAAADTPHPPLAGCGRAAALFPAVGCSYVGGRPGVAVSAALPLAPAEAVRARNDAAATREAAIKQAVLGEMWIAMHSAAAAMAESSASAAAAFAFNFGPSGQLGHATGRDVSSYLTYPLPGPVIAAGAAVMGRLLRLGDASDARGGVQPDTMQLVHAGRAAVHEAAMTLVPALALGTPTASGRRGPAAGGAGAAAASAGATELPVPVSAAGRTPEPFDALPAVCRLVLPADIIPLLRGPKAAKQLGAPAAAAASALHPFTGRGAGARSAGTMTPGAAAASSAAGRSATGATASASSGASAAGSGGGGSGGLWEVSFDLALQLSLPGFVDATIAAQALLHGVSPFTAQLLASVLDREDEAAAAADTSVGSHSTTSGGKPASGDSSDDDVVAGRRGAASGGRVRQAVRSLAEQLLSGSIAPDDADAAGYDGSSEAEDGAACFAIDSATKTPDNLKAASSDETTAVSMAGLLWRIPVPAVTLLRALHHHDCDDASHDSQADAGCEQHVWSTIALTAAASGAFGVAGGHSSSAAAVQPLSSSAAQTIQRNLAWEALGRVQMRLHQPLVQLHRSLRAGAAAPAEALASDAAVVRRPGAGIALALDDHDGSLPHRLLAAPNPSRSQPFARPASASATLSTGSGRDGRAYTAGTLGLSELSLSAVTVGSAWDDHDGGSDGSDDILAFAGGAAAMPERSGNDDHDDDDLDVSLISRTGSSAGPSTPWRHTQAGGLLGELRLDIDAADVADADTELQDGDPAAPVLLSVPSTPSRPSVLRDRESQIALAAPRCLPVNMHVAGTQQWLSPHASSVASSRSHPAFDFSSGGLAASPHSGAPGMMHYHGTAATAGAGAGAQRFVGHQHRDVPSAQAASGGSFGWGAQAASDAIAGDHHDDDGHNCNNHHDGEAADSGDYRRDQWQHRAAAMSSAGRFDFDAYEHYDGYHAEDYDDHRDVSAHEFDRHGAAHHAHVPPAPHWTAFGPGASSDGAAAAALHAQVMQAQERRLAQERAFLAAQLRLREPSLAHPYDGHDYYHHHHGFAAASAAAGSRAAGHAAPVWPAAMLRPPTFGAGPLPQWHAGGY